jgi:hypothetical protein
VPWSTAEDATGRGDNSMTGKFNLQRFRGSLGRINPEVGSLKEATVIGISERNFHRNNLYSNFRDVSTMHGFLIASMRNPRK